MVKFGKASRILANIYEGNFFFFRLFQGGPLKAYQILEVVDPRLLSFKIKRTVSRLKNKKWCVLLT